MAPREDLINSAVTFLQDPSVASAPLDQRRSFLQSKNLTPDEIQIALARAGEDPVAQQYAQPPQSSYYPQRQGPPPGYGYSQAYPPQGAWPQQFEPPRRDWRDWFIMATVTTGLSYGLYTVAKRYITPLIIPPTAPQLESDKAAVDASFSRAFELIEQLSTDTAALKEAETQRQEKLDSALEEVNSVVEELKAANKRREDESRRLGDEVRGLREMIPKALDSWKNQGDDRVKELGTELRSLKTLIGTRFGGTSQTSAPPAVNGTSGLSAKVEDAPSTTPASTASSIAKPAPAPVITSPRAQTGTPTPFSFEGRTTGRSIPAWQMAAANKTESTRNETNGTSATPQVSAEAAAAATLEA